MGIQSISKGAADRDFHRFRTVFRDDPAPDVVDVAAAPSANTERRRYPPGWNARNSADQMIIARSVDGRRVMRISEPAWRVGSELLEIRKTDLEDA